MSGLLSGIRKEAEVSDFPRPIAGGNAGDGLPLVLGDDTTDVDAFEAARALRAGGTIDALAVAVSGDAPEPLLALADYRLADPAAVETLLTWLAEELARGTSS